MGNTSSSINLTIDNINILTDIAEKIQQKSYKLDKNNIEYIISLYKTFYYPRHSLTKLEEMNSNHHHLRKIIKNNIRDYNKINSTNIDEKKYIENAYNGLKQTLHLIGV